MGAAARGVDVSSWQHPNDKPIDWEAVADAGYSFAIIKATQGTDYVNPWLHRDAEDAYAAGLLVGAYHFYVTGPTADEQGRFFVSSLIGLRLEVHAWLDWEVAEMQQFVAAGQVNGFLEAAKDGRPGCGLYCDQSWWEALKGANVTPPALWLAAPSLESAPAGATIWQRAAGPVPGIVGDVDIDEITSTRGINLPTTPPPRPTVSTVHTVSTEPEPTEPEAKPEPEPGPEPAKGAIEPDITVYVPESGGGPAPQPVQKTEEHS
jgi:lysozyme